MAHPRESTYNEGATTEHEQQSWLPVFSGRSCRLTHVGWEGCCCVGHCEDKKGPPKSKVHATQCATEVLPTKCRRETESRILQDTSRASSIAKILTKYAAGAASGVPRNQRFCSKVQISMVRISRCQLELLEAFPRQRSYLKQKAGMNVRNVNAPAEKKKHL